MSPFLELTDEQRRQYIDAEAVFSALEEAQREADTVRGSMVWREQHGRRYLLRLSTAGAQKSLGPESAETQQIYERFMQRKSLAQERLRSLKEAAAVQVRLNRALRVGRVPAVVVDVLQALAAAGLQEHFLVVGTHALYAYETACGVRVQPEATATRDIDLLFDTQKRLGFLSRLKQVDGSLLAVLRRADKTFSVRPDQLQTAVNAKGFEVDVIRRMARDGDEHPMRMSDDEDDLWAVQIGSGDQLIYSERFSQVVVAANGTMARMTTVHPMSFVRVKRAIAMHPARDPLKRPKDILQADITSKLIDEFLPHLRGDQMAKPKPAPLPKLEKGKRYRVHPGDASQAVRDIVYDVDARTLEVEYASGVRYTYQNVPKSEFLDLFRAESIGTFVNTRIKLYQYIKSSEA